MTRIARRTTRTLLVAALTFATAMIGVTTSDHDARADDTHPGVVAVWLDAPLDGSALPVGPTDLVAHWSGPDAVASVVFTVDGHAVQGTSSDEDDGNAGAPYGTLTLRDVKLTDGTHSIRAEVTDTDGGTGAAETTVVTGTGSTSSTPAHGTTTTTSSTSTSSTTTSTTTPDDTSTTAPEGPGTATTRPTTRPAAPRPSIESVSTNRTELDNLPGCGGDRANIMVDARDTSSVTMRWTMGGRSGALTVAKVGSDTWKATADGPTIAGPEHATGHATITATAKGPGGSTSHAISLSIVACKP